MNKIEIKELLLEYAGSYRLGPEINRLAIDATIQAETLESLGDLLAECSDRERWTQASAYVSGLVHCLVKTGTSKSMLRLLGFVRSLPDDMPFGAIELIGATLPSYGRIVVGPAKELCEGRFSDSSRAIGLQTLCNLYLDDMIEGDQIDYISALLDQFDQDRYFSYHLVELARNKMRNRARTAEDELDILVEI